MIYVLTLPPILPTPLPRPTCISTGFYMCHWSGPMSILLMVALGWSFRIYIPNHVCIIPYANQLFFFCVSTPVVLPLYMDIVLFDKSLRIVLDQCIAAGRGVHYIHFYHSVSAFVYNVLLVLLLSFCINSWRSFQFTWNSSSLLFLWAQ